MNKLKSLMVLIVITTMMFTVGCGNKSNTSSDATNGSINNESEVASDTESNTTSDNETEEEKDVEDNESSVLVVYFSRTGEQYSVGVIDEGNTAIVAKMIGEQTGADLWEVLPAEDIYPTDSYDDLTDIAKKEQADNARPAYAGEVPDLSKYDTIFIGAPVWWGDWPMIMYTFFENNQDGLSGKTLIPFSTHEGSGLSGFDKKLSSACPNSTIGEGLAIRGNDCQNEKDSVRTTVNDWLKGAGF